jgi:hypothetical protein
MFGPALLLLEGVFSIRTSSMHTKRMYTKPQLKSTKPGWLTSRQKDKNTSVKRSR